LLQIATGLQFLQSERLIHMDIKPSNILIASDLWVKITDFGATI
jgi:serine/threonine protein kinase